MKPKGEPVPNDKDKTEKCIEQIDLAISFLQWESPEMAMRKLIAAWDYAKEALRRERDEKQ